jgi:hypothetical protein
MKKQDLIEGVHYYINDDGNFVFTKQYHLDKGFCCGLGCKHCPYEYKNVPEPKRSSLLNMQKPPEEL